MPTSVTTKKPTVAKRSVPKRLQTLPKPAAVHETESLTDMYLTAPEDRHFIVTHYSSTKEFERLLDATITQIEASTIDAVISGWETCQLVRLRL